MSQIVEIVSEPSPTKNLGEYSDTQAIYAHFCPNFQPIYHYGGNLAQCSTEFAPIIEFLAQCSIKYKLAASK